jgi:hypothetical protein
MSEYVGMCRNVSELERDGTKAVKIVDFSNQVGYWQCPNVSEYVRMCCKRMRSSRCVPKMELSKVLKFVNENRYSSALTPL